MRPRELVSGGLLLAIALAYLWLRPALREAWPRLPLLEFFLAFALALAALRIASAASARRRPPSLPPGRKHAQAVTMLPDPEVEPLRQALQAWIQRGEQRERAASALRRAGAAAGEDLERALPRLGGRRARAAALDAWLKRSRSTPGERYP